MRDFVGDIKVKIENTLRGTGEHVYRDGNKLIVVDHTDIDYPSVYEIKLERRD